LNNKVTDSILKRKAKPHEPTSIVAQKECFKIDCFPLQLITLSNKENFL